MLRRLTVTGSTLRTRHEALQHGTLINQQRLHKQPVNIRYALLLCSYNFV